MSKESPKISKREAVANAAKQHREVCRFFDKASIRKKLPKKSKQAASEVFLLDRLLIADEPVTYKDEILREIGSETAVSAAAKRLNKLLKDLSNEFDGLREKNVIITIPSHIGGLQIGRYFTCQNTITGKYLDAIEIRDILQDTWDKFKKAKASKNWPQITERRLRKKLRSQATSGLFEKLHQRARDYQKLTMQVGLLKSAKEAIEAKLPVEAVPQGPEDHHRSWTDFDPNELLDPQDIHILSSDTGTGKTTFLRYLQLKIIEQKQFIPIFVHASDLEGLKFKDIDSFIPYLVELLELRLPKKHVKAFLKNRFREIILLIDGLSQIRGAGSDYRDLLNNLLGIFSKNIIITSCPHAVVSLEEDSNVKFLRLKPFSKKAQEKFLRKHYDRACELCDFCRELMAIPMLAYMIRTLIEKGKDKQVKSRADLYKQFVDYILSGYDHDKLRRTEDTEIGVRQAFAEISYEALAIEKPHIQKIPLTFCKKFARNHDVKIDTLLKHGLVRLVVDRTRGIDKFLYFTHQSFQEYLAAEWACANHKNEYNIIREMVKPKWKPVVRFLVVSTKGKFLDRVFCPTFKDGADNLRLFLAAECCQELTEPCQAEKTIFSNLKKLLSKKESYKEAVAGLCNVNMREARDLLISLVTQQEHYPLKKDSQKLYLHVFDSLPRIRTKLEPEQIHRLLEHLIEPYPPYRYETIRYYLRSIADAFSAEHIDMVIDYKFSDEAVKHLKYLKSRMLITPPVKASFFAGLAGFEVPNRPADYIPVGEWLYFSKESSIKQIDRVFSHFASTDPHIRFMVATIITDIITTHEIYRNRCVRIAQGSKTTGPKMSDRVGSLALEFSPNHINTLMHYGEKDIEPIQCEICWIMTHLAGLEVLCTCHLDWLIEMLKKGKPACQMAIMSQLPVFFDKLPHTHSDEIFELSKNPRPGQEALKGLTITKGDGEEPTKFSYVRLFL